MWPVAIFGQSHCPPGRGWVLPSVPWAELPEPRLLLSICGLLPASSPCGHILEHQERFPSHGECWHLGWWVLRRWQWHIPSLGVLHCGLPLCLSRPTAPEPSSHEFLAPTLTSHVPSWAWDPFPGDTRLCEQWVGTRIKLGGLRGRKKGEWVLGRPQERLLCSTPSTPRSSGLPPSQALTCHQALVK